MIWDGYVAADTSTPTSIVTAPTAEAITPTAPITPIKTLFTLPADRITSGKIVDAMIGATLEYEMSPDELMTFVNYYNGRKFTEDNKTKKQYDHDSLSDSTDVVLQLGDDPENSIVIMGYVDGETNVGYPDGSGYSISDSELTSY